MSINGFQLFQITSHCNVACFECFSLEIPSWDSSLIHLKFIINNLSMCFQRNEGLGELLGNLERQISRPHWDQLNPMFFANIIHGKIP
jgi:hypothetical protein